ncbi:MAG: DUF6788 family protein [Longimicrobiales bacterium]
MPITTERQLARLRARFEDHVRQLARIGFLLKGSIVQTRRRCGSAGCGCQSDPAKRHGPYWQWTSKINGKTVTRTLSPEQVDRYQEWMKNARRFEEIVEELYVLSAEANELLRAQERQTPVERTPPRRVRA